MNLDMGGLRSKDDKTFLRAYTDIPNEQLNDIPDSVWSLIENRLQEIPEPTKLRIINNFD